MDYAKVIKLVLENPANNLTTTSVDLLETMGVTLELEKNDEKRKLLEVQIELLDNLEFNPKSSLIDFVLDIKSESDKLKEELKILEINL